LAKKQVPIQSVGKAANHILWQEEEKLGRVNLNAYEYQPSYSQVEPSIKGGKNALGLGVKSNAGIIKTEPGPADYGIKR
jgi:hypothetical protein